MSKAYPPLKKDLIEKKKILYKAINIIEKYNNKEKLVLKDCDLMYKLFDYELYTQLTSIMYNDYK